MSVPLHRSDPIMWDVSQTMAFQGLMEQRIVVKSNVSAHPVLELSVRQITQFTLSFFQGWLKEYPSSMGSTPAYRFVGGPKPNDLDIQVVFREALLKVDQKVIEANIRGWLNSLLFSAVRINRQQWIYREIFKDYGCVIRPIPQKRGWVVDLNSATQVVFKLPFQSLHGLSPLDGWKVCLKTGRLSVMIGDRSVAKMREFFQLARRVVLRDIEDSVVQDTRAVGRLYRILHYIGHGAKLSWQDVSLGLEEAFQIDSYEMRKQYVRHLKNHFPARSSKLVDYLNFLTLIQNNPHRCKQVSHIVWTEKDHLDLGRDAYIALCIKSSPHLTPFFLRFIQGALLYDLISKNGSSSIKAWRLPFLHGEIRPFLMVRGDRMSRYFAMDYPGIQKFPAALVIEFLNAWEYLEKELPRMKLRFKDLAHTLSCLGLSSTLLSSSNREMVIDEFACMAVKPHLRTHQYHFSSDQFFQKMDTFRRFRQSPQISQKALDYVQDKLRKAAILDIGFCLQIQDALLQSHISRSAIKCYLQVISLMSARGQIHSLLNGCLEQPRLHAIAFEASLNAGAIPPDIRKKLHAVLNDTDTQLVNGQNKFKRAWVKAAKELGDADCHKKCLSVLASDPFFKEDLFAILLQLQREMERSPKQSFRILEKLLARKREVLELKGGAKELFHKIVLKMLAASTVSRAVPKLRAFAKEIQMSVPALRYEKTVPSTLVSLDSPVKPRKTVVKKISFVPIEKISIPKVYSRMFGEVEIDETRLSELFQRCLRDCLGEQALECVSIAEKHLSKKAFSSFKATIRGFVEQERSFPDLAFIEFHLPQFISRTIELLPVYAHLCPKKGYLRIDGLILTEKFAKVSMQFPDKISMLLSKAEGYESLKSSFTPGQRYNLHVAAAKFYINKNKIDFNFISIHLKQAEYIIPRCIASASQRKAMMEVLQGLAITFLKKSFTDFTVGHIFVEHVNERVLPYLKQDKYKTDGFGAECARDLLIHSCGIPAILTAMNHIEYTFEAYKENRLKFAYQKPENGKMLQEKLEEHGFGWILAPFKPSECNRLLKHALEAMTAEASIEENVLPKGHELFFYNLTFNTLNLYFELERERYRPLIETKSLSKGSPINDGINAHEKQLRDWAYYCYAVISGINRKLFDLALESIPVDEESV